MMKSAGMGMVVVVVFMVLGTPSAQGMTVSFTTSTTTSPCPTPVCALLIGCRLFTGPDGCPTCSCPDSNCDNMQCDPGQVCVMQDVECPPETTPCFPEPTCVYDISTMPETTTSPCPMVTCYEHCRISTDYNGCGTCDCSPYCEDAWCSEGEHCELITTPCDPSDYPCYPRHICVSTTGPTTSSPTTPTTTDTTTILTTTTTTTYQCPITTCGPGCRFVTGPDGCPTCSCADFTCDGWTCGQGEECFMQETVCAAVSEQCYFPRCIPTTDTPIPTTTPITTTYQCTWPMCGPGCGYDTDSYGCLICDCSHFTCGDWSCPSVECCVMQETKCPGVSKQCYFPKCIPCSDTSPSSTTTLITTDTTTIPATTPTTHIDCTWPMCGPGCSYDRDSNGCLICACSYHICEDWTCDYSGGYCVMQETKCSGVTEQCYFPACIDRTTIITTSPSTTDPTTTITTTIATTTPCQIMYSCPSFCNLYPDTDGCWICGCSSYGCTDSTCGPGEDCVIQRVDCPAVTTPCFSPICIPTTATTTITTPTTTPPCPIVTCGPFCGYTSGPDGCPTCGCPDYPPTCEHFPCGSGETCVLEDVECPGVTELCKYPRCITSNVTTDTTTISSTTLTTTFPCPIPLCLEECLPVTGPDGCLRCACPNITCQDVNCTIDEECILQDIVCITEPCFPKPTCVPRNESCTGTPNTKSCGWPGIKNRWFYNSSADACQKFHYYGCTPSPNTFVSRKACEDKCKRTDPPICLDVVCEDDCYTFKRRNQCPQCICPNPCKDFVCSADEECKLREVTCSEKTCIPQPFCDQILSGAASL